MNPSRRPDRPSARQEHFADFMLRALSPRLKKVEISDPPSALTPWTRFEVERSNSGGRLSATWYPAPERARGAVLLVHPWVPWGESYFHRRSRLRVLRAAGYHAMTFDLGGVGRSGPAANDFRFSELDDAARALEQKAGDVPLHIWGVSAGGYWAHFWLGRSTRIRGAVFEDVSSHLIQWSRRMAPWGLPFYLFYQQVLARAYHFLDLRQHAAFLGVQRAAYISGEVDRGVLPSETRELARLGGAECLLVPGADHLESIKVAESAVTDLALATLEKAESCGRDSP